MTDSNVEPAKSGSPRQQAVAHPSFDAFVATIATLRAPGGCPWDREQTHESIAPNMIEEAYEAVDAIELHDREHLREELGDVLLQVVLQSQIAADAGEFTIDDVCADVNEKMIRRHPHVFGDAQADNASEVLDLWDRVKLAEREEASPHGPGREGRTGLLSGIPRSLPALMQAQKMTRKAAAVGLDGDGLAQLWERVDAGVVSLKAAYDTARDADEKPDAEAVSPDGPDRATDAVEAELGAVLFLMADVARGMGVNAEGALRAACGKFRRRWASMEDVAWAGGRDVDELQSDEREKLWDATEEDATR